MRQPFTVLVYPVRRTGDGKSWEYLLLRRTSEREGFWQGVTGALEEGENFEEAARRELFEETGLVPDELVKIDYAYSFPLCRPMATPLRLQCNGDHRACVPRVSHLE